MKSKVIADQPRSFLLVFARGDEIAKTLVAFAEREKISGARFTAIGACERATIKYWNGDESAWEQIEVDERVEVIALNGSIGRGEDGKPRIHAHVAFGKRDGSAVGGHFEEGRVNPTLELFLDVLREPIQRKKDERTGLPLIAL
ncbi:MAG TPA: PPC domain-containing DNA-binding protein [Thermoanaerobaculia bacterium]